jgi:hypothetical protein
MKSSTHVGFEQDYNAQVAVDQVSHAIGMGDIFKFAKLLEA